MSAAYPQDDEGTREPCPESIAEVIDKVNVMFPGAMTSNKIKDKVHSILDKNGYHDETTLFATSLCCDEVNRDLEDDFRDIYGGNFSMGGLAGYAFGGVTSFGAMAHHIPESGSCLILYGPHVGIDYDGIVGKVNRRGRKGSGACCGSANAALSYVRLVKTGKMGTKELPDDMLDAQQFWVGSKLLKYTERLINAGNQVDVELPKSLFESQDEIMGSIVKKGCGEVAGKGLIALLGGIQINTPDQVPEYFLPLRFEVLNNKGEVVANLLDELTMKKEKSRPVTRHSLTSNSRGADPLFQAPMHLRSSYM